MSNIYYVYAYIRSTDSDTAAAGTPYYIGKGKGRRAYSPHRKIPVPDSQYIVFLETGLTDVGALALERRYIRWYGRKDLGTGILLNMTDGGDGSSGSPRTFTEEHRAKISKAVRGRTLPDEWKTKVSETMKGRPLPESTKKKLSQTLRGRPNPRKGMPLSESTRLKMKGRVAWNKGKKMDRPPWNKGKKGLQAAWNKGMKKGASAPSTATGSP